MSDTVSQLKEYVINANFLSCNVTLLMPPNKAVHLQ